MTETLKVAKKCPHCGAKPKGNMTFGWLFSHIEKEHPEKVPE